MAISSIGLEYLERNIFKQKDLRKKERGERERERERERENQRERWTVVEKHKIKKKERMVER